MLVIDNPNGFLLEVNHLNSTRIQHGARNLLQE